MAKEITPSNLTPSVIAGIKWQNDKNQKIDDQRVVFIIEPKNISTIKLKNLIIALSSSVFLGM